MAHVFTYCFFPPLEYKLQNMEIGICFVPCSCTQKDAHLVGAQWTFVDSASKWAPFHPVQTSLPGSKGNLAASHWFPLIGCSWDYAHVIANQWAQWPTEAFGYSRDSFDWRRDHGPHSLKPCALGSQVTASYPHQLLLPSSRFCCWPYCSFFPLRVAILVLFLFLPPREHDSKREFCLLEMLSAAAFCCQPSVTTQLQVMPGSFLLVLSYFFICLLQMLFYSYNLCRCLFSFLICGLKIYEY